MSEFSVKKSIVFRLLNPFQSDVLQWSQYLEAHCGESCASWSSGLFEINDGWMM